MNDSDTATRIATDKEFNDVQLCDRGHDMHDGLRLYDGRGQLQCRKCWNAAQRRRRRLAAHPEWAALLTEHELGAERLNALLIDPPDNGATLGSPDLKMLYRQQDWMPSGLCRDSDVDPDWWFDESGYEMAKAVCRDCYFQSDCAAYAAKAGERHGVYGGLDPKERGYE